jgi:hypothetical protein
VQQLIGLGGLNQVGVGEGVAVFIHPRRVTSAAGSS